MNKKADPVEITADMILALRNFVPKFGWAWCAEPSDPEEPRHVETLDNGWALVTDEAPLRYRRVWGKLTMADRATFEDRLNALGGAMDRVLDNWYLKQEYRLTTLRSDT